MTLHLALAEDQAGHIEIAARLYEDAVQRDPDIEGLINLGVLYWCATDYGFWTGHGLTRNFVDRAGQRFPEILRQAADMFPSRPEPIFWSQYIAWADLGQSFPDENASNLIQQHPTYVEPAFFLFSISQGAECAEQARQLLQRSKQSPTCRNRYVASVIEATFGRMTPDR